MKILLTGATGFIGSYVFKYLAKLGYEVNNITTNEFMNQDWSKLDDFDLTGSGKPDCVIHIAWVKADLHDHKHIEFAEWSINFLNECNKRGIRVINLGSSSEYGVKYEPMREDMICEPINTYGIAKLMVTLYAKKLGYNTLRIFSPVGEGGKNFASIYEKSEKWGDPMNVRDYQDILHVGRAVERLLHAKHLYAEIINVCSGVQTSNRAVTYDTFNNEPTNPKWNTYKNNQYEPSMWQGDKTKMKKLLNL